jgi:hypothetical protein
MMDASADALCARLDALTSEAIDARATIQTAVAETCSLLAEGIALRRVARRERDGELVAEKRLLVASAVAVAFSDDAVMVTSAGSEVGGVGERTLRARADGAITRAARGNSAAGCIRNCSERVYVAWGETVLRMLSAFFLLDIPDIPDRLTATIFSSRTDDATGSHSYGRDRADTAHEA